MVRPALSALLLGALAAGCAQPAAETRPAATAAELRPAAPARAPVLPAGNPAVNGTVLPTDRTIAENLAAAPSLSTFARLLAAGGETELLKGAGPFTLFASSDEAFGRLQPGTVDALLKPENHAALVKLLDLHRVAGTMNGMTLLQRVAAGGGRTSLTSAAGEPITVTTTDGIVTLTDAGGNKSYIEITDVRESNGVVHVVNGVLVPRLP